MSTIMEEKIKQAFQEWKQADQDQPKENDMKDDVSVNKRLSNVLLHKIQINPGITGKQLRVHISQNFPNVPLSYVPAILKNFYDNNIVSREAVPPLVGSRGGSTFAYTFVPIDERNNMPKREKTKVYTKKKAKHVHKEDKGITTLIPTEQKLTRPLEVGPTTLHITISTSLGAYAMKLEEAKFIYQQLNQIFGGVR